MNVLYIEDDVIPQRIVKRVAAHMGHEVLCATTCAEGYTLSHQAIDLILLDVNLPDDNGLNLAKRLRAEQVTTPIVAVTGDLVRCNRDMALAAGCTEFRAKPLLADDVKELFTRYAVS